MTDERRRILESQLSAYLDDELGPQERRDVEALLAADEGARALLAQLRATIQTVQGLPRAKASDRLIESLRARMERQALLEDTSTIRYAGHGGRSYLRWTAAAAVIGLAVTAGYLMWPRGNQPVNRYAAVDKEQPRPQQPAGSGGYGSLTNEGLNKPSSPLAMGIDSRPVGGAPAGPSPARGMAPVDTVSPMLAGKPSASIQKGTELSTDYQQYFYADADTDSPKLPTPAQPPALVVADNKPANEAGAPAEKPATDVLSLADTKDIMTKTASAPSSGLTKRWAGDAVAQVEAGTTVVELTFADTDGRADAVRQLRENYPAGQPAKQLAEYGFADGLSNRVQTKSSPADQEATHKARLRHDTSVESLVVQVPNKESAERIVSELRQSINTAQNVRVVRDLEIRQGGLPIMAGYATVARGKTTSRPEATVLLGQDNFSALYDTQMEGKPTDKTMPSANLRDENGTNIAQQAVHFLLGRHTEEKKLARMEEAEAAVKQDQSAVSPQAEPTLESAFGVSMSQATIASETKTATSQPARLYLWVYFSNIQPSTATHPATSRPSQP